MAKQKDTLLIVESPAKARTIERYLGSGYTVAASMGHLIDLPKSRVAVDVEIEFFPFFVKKVPRLKDHIDIQIKTQ